ncbi:putative integral to membrane protein [Papiliotrema laurentii]|uniref:Integral to membrane protein n=1 Tax=Papiliotrema laurentii TaxID=5418 RepID=A0AAD9FUY3_PAPLA|nr:putative integral to membrane protein [Papiliotrema laurentii]
MAWRQSIQRSLLALAVLAATVSARQAKTCPDPNVVDPANDTCNPLRYIPNLALNVLAAVLYFITAILLTWQHWRFRANYMLCLVIGTYCEAIGLVLRVVLRKNPHSTGLYIVQYLFVVLSPCAFLAGDYILLGRLVQHLNAPQYLRPLKPAAVSWTFIISDVVTFLIQAAGGGLSISDNLKTAQAGGNIFLAGIAAQMASFVLFSILWAMFAIRARYQDQVLWSRTGWKPLHWALGFTCICFLIRSVFRTIELSQGYIGYLATHERFFLGLDTLPLWLGVTTFVWFWPGRYLTPESKVKPDTEEDVSGEMGMTEMRDEQPSGQASVESK